MDLGRRMLHIVSKILKVCPLLGSVVPFPYSLDSKKPGRELVFRGKTSVRLYVRPCGLGIGRGGPHPGPSDEGGGKYGWRNYQCLLCRNGNVLGHIRLRRGHRTTGSRVFAWKGKQNPRSSELWANRQKLVRKDLLGPC